MNKTKELLKVMEVDAEVAVADDTEESAVFGKLVGRIAMKPTTDKVQLYAALVSELAGFIINLPSGELKINKIAKDFLKSKF